MPRSVFGIDFWDEDVEGLARRIATEPVPVGTGPRLVVTANIDHIVRLHDQPAFRVAYDHAWAVTADGWPVVAYARTFGHYRQGRVTGADMFPLIVRQLDPARHRVFCVTSSSRTADKLHDRLELDGTPRHMVETEVPPFGFERDDDYCRQLCDRIAGFGTTHLIMGVGAPKSEVWVDRHREYLGDIYACCFGAAINFYAGTRKRAPTVVQLVGMEWAWRLLGEPQRLALRYLKGGPRYAMLVAQDMIAARRTGT